ncbi:MAG: hypothetical protein PHC83_03320 [Bacteroidales bacterium]|nr:hypothetical protein [Bacteroidales bacterium]
MKIQFLFILIITFLVSLNKNMVYSQISPIKDSIYTQVDLDFDLNLNFQIINKKKSVIGFHRCYSFSDEDYSSLNIEFEFSIVDKNDSLIKNLNPKFIDLPISQKPCLYIIPTDSSCQIRFNLRDVISGLNTFDIKNEKLKVNIRYYVYIIDDGLKEYFESFYIDKYKL